MSIPQKHAYRSIYHFTHIDNLPGLLRTGFLAKNHPKFPLTKYKSVAAEGIQRVRAKMPVTCGPKGVVHDYVPLYFGSVSPMFLGVVNKKNIDQMDVLYFEFPISLVTRDDVVFTDASANTEYEPPNFFSNPADLVNLNWKIIDSRKWSTPEHLLHQRMAEVLIHRQVSILEAQRIVVWNEGIQRAVEKVLKRAGGEFPPIEFESFDRPHYFTRFMEGKQNDTIVVGPRQLFKIYKSACKEVAENVGKNAGAPFRTAKELLLALRQDFGCLPQTSDVVGLKSRNVIHKATVDSHSIEVAQKLKLLQEYNELSIGNKVRLELAAYLHDIGKGPKSRWASTGGMQKVDPDHAAQAVPMLVNIFTEHVASVKQETAEIIIKLVCYHDLVGEVLGKGRDEKQISDVVNNETELKMLFALGKADATSLREAFWDDERAAILFRRCLADLKDQRKGGEA